MSNGMKDAPPNTKLTSTSVLQLRGNYSKCSCNDKKSNNIIFSLRLNRTNDCNGCRAKLWIYWRIWTKDFSRRFNFKSLRGF